MKLNVLILYRILEVDISATEPRQWGGDQTGGEQMGEVREEGVYSGESCGSNSSIVTPRNQIKGRIEDKNRI